MENEETINPEELISDEIAIATKAAIDQMLLYFSQSRAADVLNTDELLKTYILAIISIVATYADRLTYDSRQQIEAEIKKIIYETTYTEQDMKLAKMPVMGNA